MTSDDVERLMADTSIIRSRPNLYEPSQAVIVRWVNFFGRHRRLDESKCS
jgi:hypothetical protein